MGRMEAWILQNWFNVLSAIGIVASLMFTAVSVRAGTETQRISNLLLLTQNHRKLWVPPNLLQGTRKSV